MWNLIIILACTTISCPMPQFKPGDCSIDKYPAKNFPVYTRRITRFDYGRYFYRFGENELDKDNPDLHNNMPYELFDEYNTKVECPAWLK